MALRPGDMFLLCSDGLTDMVMEADIAARLTADGTLCFSIRCFYNEDGPVFGTATCEWETILPRP